MEKRYSELFNTDDSISKDLFNSVNYPWEVFPILGDYIIKLGNTLPSEYEKHGDNIWIHNSAKIADSAYINGPCIICEGAELRHCSFIRGNAIIGKDCVVGNSTEVKNSILFDNAKAPHFNYIGDSIMGESSHIGAGVILSNVKSDNSNIVVKDKEEIPTCLRKFGGILGSNVDVGCNSVIFPGTIIFPNTNIYPLSRVRGVIESNMIVKDMDNIVEKRS